MPEQGSVAASRQGSGVAVGPGRLSVGQSSVRRHPTERLSSAARDGAWSPACTSSTPSTTLLATPNNNPPEIDCGDRDTQLRRHIFSTNHQSLQFPTLRDRDGVTGRLPRQAVPGCDRGRGKHLLPWARRWECLLTVAPPPPTGLRHGTASSWHWRAC